MKIIHAAAVAAAIVSMTAFTGCEKEEPTLKDKVEQAGSDLGKAAGKAADKTVEAVKDAADKTAEAAKEAADATKEAEAVACDVALVPVGGTYTMNAKKAAELINRIRPACAIPTHYGGIVGSAEDAEVFAAAVKPPVAVEIKMQY